MNICGIVCEYNPFHRGHAWQIGEIRRRLGEETGILCVMSGDFVQRGEAAAFEKHARARAAVIGGADLVVELPLPWCVSSAEGFAKGGVELLGAAGIMTHLAFGSECGNLNALAETAELLLRPELDGEIRSGLREGLSYAAARQRGAERLRGHALPELTRPNDILALEYLKALKTQKLSVEPLAIPRRGAAHDSAEESAFLSASELRGRFRAGEDIADLLPEGVWAALSGDCAAADSDRLETALLSRLRFLPQEAFAVLPDVSEGLENRLYAAVRTAPTPDALLDAASAKRYPRARLRRMLLCAALGVRAEDKQGSPPYLRVLAANARGLELLRLTKDRCTLPVVTKPSAVRELGTEAERIFRLGAEANDLYRLCLPEESARIGDSDWRTGPAIVK